MPRPRSSIGRAGASLLVSLASLVAIGGCNLILDIEDPKRKPICGDGVIAGDEACDDDNEIAGDGCDGACAVEHGYSCSGEPSACSSTCGDGVVAANEPCDDGNGAAGDGCDPGCQVEEGFSCSGEPSQCAVVCGDGIVAKDEACDDGDTAAGDGCDSTCAVEYGYSCSGEPSGCSSTCGDGLIASDEGCDDGDAAAGDGCGADCAVEHGYSCSGEPSACSSTCGDGVVAASEPCDDGNDTEGDGCGADCQVEHGYECSTEPSVCVIDCGDGLLGPNEQCDDGNEAAGDGCDAACQLEPGFLCDGAEPTICEGICGDELVVQGEGCDDKNLIAGDGCSAVCQVEAGYMCDGEPSVCIGICGDGILVPGEQCDDGNMAAGDCCSSACKIEMGCEIEPNNSTAQADARAADPLQPVSFSGSGVIKGQIGVVADVDYFVLDLLPASSVVRFETFDATGQDCAAGTDTRLWLYNSFPVIAISNDITSGIATCSSIVMTMSAGSYYVKVEENGNNATIAGYSLEVSVLSNGGVESEMNDTIATADPVAGTNVWIAGSHQVIADSDYFAVTIPGPSKKSIRAEIIEGGVVENCESGGIASRLTLYDDASNQLADDDVGGGRGACSLIDGTGTTPLHPNAHLLDPGTYYLRVRASSTSGGSAAQFDYKLAITIR